MPTACKTLWFLTVRCGQRLALARLTREGRQVWGQGWTQGAAVPVGNAVTRGPRKERLMPGQSLWFPCLRSPLG